MIKNNHDYSIGIISPFRAQGSLIRNMLQDVIKKDINVDTVERYQGSERDVIIISTGLNYPLMLKSIESVVNINGKIIDRKLNVAITRAKQQLIITGNATVLEQSESYRKLIEKIKQKNAYFELDDLK
jgi:DNA replication ATP-dependent helicase Dna2